MKELKDLLKANKYLEAKAFILSNLDKVEECIDVVFEELLDRETPEMLHIKAEEMDQETIKSLTERLKEATSGTYSYRLTDEPFPKITFPKSPAVGPHVPLPIPSENFIEVGLGGMPDDERCPATLKVGGKTVLKFDGISVKVDDKGKIICGGVANMGDEHNIVDPKGVDMSYLRAYYDTPNEKIDTLINEAIDNKKETP